MAAFWERDSKNMTLRTSGCVQHSSGAGGLVPLPRLPHQLNTYGNSTTNSRGRKQFAIRHNQTQIYNIQTCPIYMSFTSEWTRFPSAASVTSILEASPTYGSLKWCVRRLTDVRKSCHPISQASSPTPPPPPIDNLNKPSHSFTMFSSLQGIFKQPRKTQNRKIVPQRTTLTQNNSSGIHG